MLFQLHWQNINDPKDTEMVAQGNFDNPEAMHAWMKELLDRRGSEMPEGFWPMICTEDSPLFWLTPLKQKTQ